ncbi:MAG: sugar nucleotide-binding protein [Bacteroidetes bacterium]|nr:sugar nucleotide-binding protein [Bacteroidota bacterium]
MTVINDQFRSPTLAEDLADACVSAALKKATGIYHVSGREVMNILDIVRIVADFFELDQKFIHTSSEKLKQRSKTTCNRIYYHKSSRELDFTPRTFNLKDFLI